MDQNRRILPFQWSIVDVLKFLQELLDKGLTFSIIKFFWHLYVLIIIALMGVTAGIQRTNWIFKSVYMKFLSYKTALLLALGSTNFAFLHRVFCWPQSYTMYECNIYLRLFLWLVALWNLSFWVFASFLWLLKNRGGCFSSVWCEYWIYTLTALRMCVYLTSWLPVLLIQPVVELCLNRSSPSGLWRLTGITLQESLFASGCESTFYLLLLYYFRYLFCYVARSYNKIHLEATDDLGLNK